jgi:hypothetical protein
MENMLANLYHSRASSLEVQVNEWDMLCLTPSTETPPQLVPESDAK